MWGAERVRVSLRGNVPALFLLFFAATTLLGGAMYQAYEAYSSTSSPAFGFAAAASAVGFAFSLLIVSRILYKATA